MENKFIDDSCILSRLKLWQKIKKKHDVAEYYWASEQIYLGLRPASYFHYVLFILREWCDKIIMQSIY